LEIRIGGSVNDYLILDVLGRTHPDSTNETDLNWLNIKASVSVGGFRCEIRQNLYTDELNNFKNDLEKLHHTLNGVAELFDMEGWIYLKLVGDEMGHILCHGEITDGYNYDNCLKFVTTLDQTFLPETIDALVEVLKAYPVIGLKSHVQEKNEGSFLRKILHKR